MKTEQNIMKKLISRGSDNWSIPYSLSEKYQLIFRVSSDALSIRGKILWNRVKESINAAFVCLESEGFKVYKLIINEKDLDRFIKKTSFKKKMWGAQIYTTDLLPQGYFLCESKI